MVNKIILLGILSKVNCMHTLTKSIEKLHYFYLTLKESFLLLHVSKPYFS